MRCDKCESELERTIDGDIFCSHCRTCYVPVKIQAEPCDCSVLEGEPHYHINDMDVIPWDIYLDAIAGHEVCIAREGPTSPQTPVVPFSISSKVKKV